MISDITASTEGPDGARSPESSYSAVLIEQPTIAASSAAVLCGHKTLQTKPNFAGPHNRAVPRTIARSVSRDSAIFLS
jgi:hypothetical protein